MAPALAVSAMGHGSMRHSFSTPIVSPHLDALFTGRGNLYSALRLGVADQRNDDWASRGTSIASRGSSASSASDASRGSFRSGAG